MLKRDSRRFFSLQANLLKIVVTVALGLAAAVAVAYAEARRRIDSLAPIGRPITGPEAKENTRVHEAMHRGEAPEPD